MIEYVGIIYKYTSPSGKCYIGQTTNKRKCYQYDGTILVGIYSSVKEASNYTGICKTAISSVLSGRRKTAGGFIWMKEKI